MGKPRVIISSDIGGSDPDDMESMAHALIYADKFDIEAIISTPTKNSGRASDIYKALDAYTKDYNNLKTWGDYQTPESLKSVVYQGNINVPGPSGYSSATAASNAIIKAAHEGSAADPVYIMTWGAMTDVAQALHDDPSIAGKIRILSSNGWNGTQDPYSRDYIYNNFKDVWWIESKSTHRGIYVNASGSEGNAFNMNEAKGHGALGDYFYNARPWGVKMGDSWSIAYLVDQIDNNNPGGDSWGGSFVKSGHGPNFYTDDPNAAYKVGAYSGAAYVREHQNDIYNDMYKMFDRAKSANPNAVNVDDPVVAKPDAASTQNDKAIVVKVLANDTAADGGLKIASADASGANGGTVLINADGTITYTPKAGYIGSDTFKYIAKDVDGDTSTATVTVTVTAPGAIDPTPPPGAGTGNGVVAADDKYTIDAGKKLYFNTSHILMNDKGADGGLKATVSATSANGVVLEKWDDGTVVYKASACNGTDRIDYVLTDKDGSSDVGSVLITVKNGAVSTTQPDTTPPPDTTTPPSGGTGNVVLATDDTYNVDAGKKLYFNTSHLLLNDKGLDGGLKAAIGVTSANGVALEKWDDGTVVYKASTVSGTDRIDYILTDKDGSADIGSVLITVKNGVVASAGSMTLLWAPASGSPTTPPLASTLTGADNGLVANDDIYRVDAGKSLYLNTRYVTMNDKGGSDALSVVSVDAASERGVKVSWGGEGTAADGTLIYKAPAGFEGIDKITYKVIDASGHSDLGTILVHVGTMI